MAMLTASRFTVGSVLEEQADTDTGDSADPPADLPVIDHESAFEAGLALILNGLTRQPGAWRVCWPRRSVPAGWGDPLSRWVTPEQRVAVFNEPFRAHVSVDAGQTVLRSRRGTETGPSFPEVVTGAVQLPDATVLDGVSRRTDNPEFRTPFDSVLPSADRRP
ncbi:hypothetical protein [Streptomyces sp. AK04-3B]|uniref:hypothetical protein n=1 Tax=Streptomyces sp. AK04-3B TaxID=3028650 RepID=UPI0029B33D61|nr:hypothetical protein [Streptomyces sp. AK04-3B]MDX3799117.1 hypothetical protein [Streptomyces sp. AK04-3B]